MSHKTAILSFSNHHFIITIIFICLPEIEKKASVKCSGRFIITEIANASDAVDTNEKTENNHKNSKKRAKKTKNRITKLNTETHELKVFPLKILLVLCERNLSPGGYFRTFWVVMCRWDPETLSLYQS